MFAFAVAATVVAPGSTRALPPSIRGGGDIESMVQSVDDDSVFTNVVVLETFLTRRADTPQATQAATWIAGRFAAWGADSVYAHKWSSAYAPNVVGVRRGTTRPHRIVLVGGHYDSITPTAFAPGADDNASGTSCVLECARVLCRERFEYTLQFVAFSAEELGLVGSNAYAAHLLSTGDSLVAMLNVDMIGYLAPGDRRDLDIVFNAQSQWLRDLTSQTTSQYVPGLPVVDGAYRSGARSDQDSFWARSYSAISFFEDADSSPFIHTGDDVIGTSFNDLDLATRATRAAVALLATLARPLTTAVAVQDLWAQHTADGNLLTWRLADPAAYDAVTVQRATAAAGPWVEATALPLAPAVQMQFLDRDGFAAAWYRLALRTGAGDVTLSPAIAAGAPTLGAAVSLLPPIDRGDVGVDVRWSIGSPQRADLAVFDARGRRVRLLTSGPRAAGSHLVTWDRRDEAGVHAARGVYFVHLRAGGTSATRKVVVAR